MSWEAGKHRIDSEVLSSLRGSDIKSKFSWSGWDEYKSVPQASLREDMETREWAHGCLLLIFKVRRRTDCGVSHQPMCENLRTSHEAGDHSVTRPGGHVEGALQINVVQADKRISHYCFVFVFLFFKTKKSVTLVLRAVVLFEIQTEKKRKQTNKQTKCLLLNDNANPQLGWKLSQLHL